VVELLLNKKADVNARMDTDGATALYIAAKKGHAEVVKLLLANKADVNVRSTAGDKPIDVARLHHHSDIVKLLQ